MRAVVATRTGGPEVLELQELREPDAGPDQVRIRVVSAGVNFADVLTIRGKYANPPFIPGREVAGYDENGRPVAAMLSRGGYAEIATADRALTMDATGLDLRTAGGYALTTLTAYFALKGAIRVQPGESVLVTAAAGGLGSTAIQVARVLGAGRVIAIASTEEKRRMALRYGADTTANYEDEFPECDVVFDSVGGEVFAKAWRAAKVFGRVAALGSSSGVDPVLPPFEEARRRGVGVFAYSISAMLERIDAGELTSLTSEAGELLRSGRVLPPVERILPLEKAAQALQLLLSRKSVGKLVLTTAGH